MKRPSLIAPPLGPNPAATAEPGLPPKAARRPSRTYSFAWLLTVISFLLLLTAISLIAIVSSYFTRRSVAELADRIVAQTLARVELRTRALLDQAENQNAQGKLLIEGRQLPPGDSKLLGAYFAHSLTVLGELTDLGFGLEENGDYVFAERLPNQEIRVREYVLDDSGQRVVRDWRWNGAERTLLKTAPWDGYDPRQRPFYRQAASAAASGWTETYQFWQKNERGAMPGVTFATPLFDGSGKLLGVIDADLSLEALCGFLRELRKGMLGYAFLAEHRQDGSFRLIAHPDPAMLSPDDESQTLSDPVAAAFLRAAWQDGAGRARLAAGKSVAFSANHRKYLGSARTFQGAGQPDWTVAVVIPVNELMAGVYRNDQRAFWLGLGCLILTATIALRVARRIAEPLRHLTQEARAIGRLELHSKPSVESRVEEVARLSVSMCDMKSSLRSFQKFVPGEVVRGIVAGLGEARPGGQRATLTLFFSDIVGFTPVAEQMSPEELVELMGQYLGAMSRVIYLHQGTVDKFIGDGIMAFWGAPAPHPEPAAAACRAAWQSQRALDELRAGWRRYGKPELHARIGLHTGSVIIGNIGSEDRLNYTALGDTVNVASRLEGLNKLYGTQILLSAACVEAAGASIVARPVDNHQPKGRIESVVMYELLGLAGDVSAETLEVARLTQGAFAEYAKREFRAAAELYRAVLALRPDDLVSAMMALRCETQSCP